MKIGYLLILHKDPIVSGLTIKKLLKDNNNFFVIHIDKKVNIEDIKKHIPNSNRIQYLDNRYDIKWGSISAVKATLDMMKVAIENGCQRCVVLQQGTYPLWSSDKIYRYFDNKFEMIPAVNATCSKEKKLYMKCWGYYIFDGIDRTKVSWKLIVAKIASAISRIGIKFSRGYYVTAEKHRMDFYFSSAHIALTRDCCKYILNFVNKEPKILEWFNHKHAPDENFFATIIYNSSFKNNIYRHYDKDDEKVQLSDLTDTVYFEYPKSIKVFDESDLELLLNSQRPFARKFEDNKSLKLIEKLEVLQNHK